MQKQRSRVWKAKVILLVLLASWGHSWRRWQKSFLKTVSFWILKPRVCSLTHLHLHMFYLPCHNQCFFQLTVFQFFTEMEEVQVCLQNLRDQLMEADKVRFFPPQQTFLNIVRLYTGIKRFFLSNRIMKLRNCEVSNLWKSAKKKMKWFPSFRLLWIKMLRQLMKM